MRSRLTVLTALSVAVALVTLTACPAPQPVLGKFGTAWWETVVKAVSVIFGTPPDNTQIDCSVVLFDQSIRPEDFRGQFTPVHTPNDIYAWLGGCFGAQHPRHIVPTFRATGRPNTPGGEKMAVCWVDSFNPDGDMIFDCHFDRILPDQSWVPFTSTNWQGYLAVGA